MRRAVQLVHHARELYRTDNPVAAEDIRIALSLGPFGASLPTAQEFGGFYPPPYGPKAYAPDDHNINAFRSDAESTDSVEALKNFHLQRLEVFAGDEETWKKVDFVAFETVPLAREVKAIRQAMRTIHANGALRKPWWISLVFPDGKYPETSTSLPGEHLSVKNVVRAVFDEMDDGDTPDAIGINCTKPQYISTLLDEYAEAVGTLDSESAPGLVVYPNGGAAYDVETKTWSSAEHGAGRTWAVQLAEIVGVRKDKWSGVLVGGCCKTGPEDIRSLAELVKELE